MQFETEEPAHRGFASLRQAGKSFMTMDAVIVAYRQGGAVDIIDASLFVHTAEQEKYQRHKGSFLYGNELLVAGHARKILAQQGHSKPMVEVLQILEAGTMQY